MKICIIGDSHIGSLSRAWREKLINEFDHIQIDFFGCPSDGLKGLKLQNGCLIPESEKLERIFSYVSGGKNKILLSEYSCFIVYGMGMKPFFEPEQFYSSSFLEVIIDQNVKKALAFRIIEMLCIGGVSKILVGHNPLRANKNNDSKKYNEKKHVSYENGVKLLNDNVFSQLNASLVLQPKNTIAGNGRNTLSLYTVGSKRLDFLPAHETMVRKHPDNDFGHMNDKFGEIWLKNTLELLQ